MEEPCCKKQRIDAFPQTFQIKPILSDELCEPISLEPVIVTRIADRKSISSIIMELSQRLPMPSLQHLKRVRQNEVILCRAADVELVQPHKLLLEEDVLRVKNYTLSQCVSVEITAKLCENLYLVNVASTSPKLRWQYELLNQLWPCKFHANKYNESLFDGSNFSQKDKEFHCKVASLLSRLADRESAPMGLCIDPRTNSVVAVARSATERNPNMHCPMVLIDFVARTQGEGAWQYTDTFLDSHDVTLNFRGIPKQHYEAIRELSNDEIQFGAEVINPTAARRKITEDMMNENNLVKYGPYLCTGYDVYLSVEPCLTCAMALLHSRVRRIFYLETAEDGALQTKVKLHTIKDLNHHFEVFYCKNERKSRFNKCS